ncbi:FGGY-family carbohydrate kinase [Bythopirellula polymerisocia]|uniref:ATP:glycerol 3-phosphotransferase n=1 Tax=Bythopirellula polymerisocia TaxID=2528003 RepID=A0A5C6CYK7_9BACT|nr:glycerol kinase GlpK [Bythopirellula polymerisocia]TWU27729.1 Glycerol kinase [Bythopirellula polymerisocia]
MSLILAIDQSTSATKAILFDESGHLIDKASCEHRQIYPQAGWVEHDPEEIWKNLRAVVDQLAQRKRPILDDLIGLSIANQRETFVVFDRQTGKPLHNAIVWQCRRGARICEELSQQGNDLFVRERTGLKLDTYFPASKIAWLMREKPEIAAKLHSGEAVIGTIDAFLIHRLTQGSEFATDHTNASRTLLFDVHKLQWDQMLCDMFGVPMRSLPEVRECDAHFGETDVDGVLNSKVPICGVMGDSQASLFAQQCYESGTGKATFGTGTSVMVNVGNRSELSIQGAVLALAWVINKRPTYALEGLINYSSATIAWLKDQLGLIADAAESETLANQVEDNGGVYLVPAFAGLSAPHWNAEARAAILGMSGHTTKAHIARAALESISYQIRDVLDMISAESGKKPKLMQADGGPTRNKFLMQFTADMTQLAWNVSSVPESSALGAAMAGLLGLGKVSTLFDLAGLPRENEQYVPQMSQVRADALHCEWQMAVRRVL